MTTQTEVKPLIELLGQTDALFSPVRRWSNPAQVAAICERREAFFHGGLPWRSGGGDAAERKRRERAADELEQAKHLVFSRTNGKRTGCQLSDAADWQLRSLVGSFGTGGMLVAMHCLRALWEPALPDLGNGVPETWLMGCDYDSRDAGRRMARLAEMFLSATVRGWVDSHSDVDGRVAYTITSAGHRLLDAKRNSLPDDRDLPEHDPAAGECYEAALDVARAELVAAQPTRENHIVIPFSSGLWADDSERPAAIPPVFKRDGEVRSVAAMTAALRRSLKHQITAPAQRRRKTTPLL